MNWIHRFRFFLWILVCLFSFQAFSAHAGEEHLTEAEKVALFSEANALFREANELVGSDKTAARELYRKAAMRFERLEKGGIANGRLYYNIGNCYARMGDVGRAVLNYKKAELFSPYDENLKKNLMYVQGLRKDKIEMREKEKIMKTLFFWHYDLSMSIKGALLGMGYLAFWGCVLYRYFRGGPGTLTWSLVISLALTLMMASSLLVDRHAASRSRLGVVVVDEVIARKGDGTAYQPSFKEPLHAGLEFTLLEERKGWIHVELLDGRRCWLPSESSEIVTLSFSG